MNSYYLNTIRLSRGVIKNWWWLLPLAWLAGPSRGWPKKGISFLRSREVFLKLYDGSKFICLLEEVYTVVEVYAYNEYRVFEIDAKTIIDVGANIGISTVQLAHRYPDAFIWAIEPSLDAIYRLKININLNRLSDRVEIVQAAVGGKDGTGILMLGSTSAINSVSLNDHEENSNSEEIKILSLASVIDLTNSNCIDIMKLDCEGAEYPFFQQSDVQDLKKINYIIGEVHKIGSKTHNEMVTKFKEADYNFVLRNIRGEYGIFEAKSV